MIQDVTGTPAQVVARHIRALDQTGKSDATRAIELSEAATKFVQKYGDFAVKQINRLRRLKKNHPEIAYEINPNYLWIKYWCPCKVLIDGKEHYFQVPPGRIEKGTAHFCSVSHESSWRLANDSEFARKFHKAGAKAIARETRKPKIEIQCFQCHKKVKVEAYRFEDRWVKKYGAPEFCSAKCRGLYRNELGLSTWHTPNARRKAAKTRKAPEHGGRVLYCHKRGCHKRLGYYSKWYIEQGRKQFCVKHARERRIKALEKSHVRWIEKNPEAQADNARLASQKSAENWRNKRVEISCDSCGKKLRVSAYYKDRRKFCSKCAKTLFPNRDPSTGRFMPKATPISN